MLGVNERFAILHGFVTSAENEAIRRITLRLPPTEKQIFWVCPSCFEHFRSILGFRLSDRLTLADVLDGPALGPSIGP
jgi:hypothetical protein